MPDVLKKYTYGGVKVAFITLEKTIKDTVSAHSLDEICAETTAYAEIVAAIIVASCKEDGASVSVSIKKEENLFGAVAENDGRVCGFHEKISPLQNSGIVLEVTRRLYLRGDYKSIVSANDVSSAVNEYFRTSLQVEARFALGKTGNVYYGLLVEQFPITCEREEIWRNAANEEIEYLEPIENGNLSTERELMKKYTLMGVVPIKFGCTCSSASVSEIIKSIPHEELKATADENGYIEIRCKFCGKTRKRKVC